MAHSHSSCPLCGAQGRTGDPCAAPTCSRRRYHFVPDVYLDDGDDVLDGLVGQRWQDVLLVRRLGAGGVGAIYLALQMPIEMQVAVKFLTRDAPPALAARLRDEAVALSRLHHHNIVQLLKFGEVGPRAFLVMEYVEGGRTLTDALDRGELDRPAQVRVLRQLIEALEAAHALDVVHRDVKPDNIMLTRAPREPHFVKLVDFGLAKFTDGGRESTQLAAGTPTYMAPEQITRRNIGPWTDWYAVAMIALELLLDHRPYAHLETNEVVREKMREGCDPARGLAERGLAPAVTRFFHLALAPDPRNRLRQAAHFRDHFNAMVEALPPPETPLEPTMHGQLAGDELQALFADMPDPEEAPLPSDSAERRPAFREAHTVRERDPEPTQEHRRPDRATAPSGDSGPVFDPDATLEQSSHRLVPPVPPRPRRATPQPHARSGPHAPQPALPPHTRGGPRPAPPAPDPRRKAMRETARLPDSPLLLMPPPGPAPPAPSAPAKPPRPPRMRTMLTDPFSGTDGTSIVPQTRARRWLPLTWIMLLVGLGILGAVVWLLLNPPRSSRAGATPAVDIVPAQRSA